MFFIMLPIFKAGKHLKPKVERNWGEELSQGGSCYVPCENRKENDI